MRIDKTGIAGSIHVVVSSVFGIGYFPFAPATLATFVMSVVLYVLWGEAGFLDLAAAIVIFVLAVASSWQAEKKLGHDAHEIVIDEICGTMVTLLFIDRTKLSVVAAAFLLFRFFDILKPWPVNRSQKLPGGIGIVMDDVLAGVYANLVLRGLIAARIV
jgi:phosphatidylglycerophosphatase A